MRATPVLHCRRRRASRIPGRCAPRNRRPGGGDLLAHFAGQPPVVGNSVGVVGNTFEVVIWHGEPSPPSRYERRPPTASPHSGRTIASASRDSRHPVPRLAPIFSASYVGRCLWPFRKRRWFSRQTRARVRAGRLRSCTRRRRDSVSDALVASHLCHLYGGCEAATRVPPNLFGPFAYAVPA